MARKSLSAPERFALNANFVLCHSVPSGCVRRFREHLGNHLRHRAPRLSGQFRDRKYK